MATAIMFQPKNELQLNLLAEMARQMHINFDFIPAQKLKGIKRELNETSLAALREAESGECTRYESIEDYLKDFS